MVFWWISKILKIFLHPIKTNTLWCYVPILLPRNLKEIPDSYLLAFVSLLILLINQINKNNFAMSLYWRSTALKSRASATLDPVSTLAARNCEPLSPSPRVPFSRCLSDRRWPSASLERRPTAYHGPVAANCPVIGPGHSIGRPGIGHHDRWRVSQTGPTRECRQWRWLFSCTCWSNLRKKCR